MTVSDMSMADRADIAPRMEDIVSKSMVQAADTVPTVTMTVSEGIEPLGIEGMMMMKNKPANLKATVEGEDTAMITLMDTVAAAGVTMSMTMSRVKDTGKTLTVEITEGHTG